MSSGVLRSNFLSFISNENIPYNYQNEIIHLIENIDDHFLDLIYTLSNNLNQSNKIIFNKNISIILQHCSIQLADDIVDDEYSAQFIYKKELPVLLMVLENLFTKTLNKCNLSKKLLNSVSNNNLIIASALHDELRNKKWCKKTYIKLAENMGGYYYKSIFSILSNSTFSDTNNIGFKLGTIIHIITDIISGDNRFFEMNNKEKLDIIKFIENEISNLNIPSYLENYKISILITIKKSKKYFSN